MGKQEIQRKIESGTELITGIMKSDGADLIHAGKRILKESFKGRAANQLKDEIEGLRKKGRVKDDYFESEQNHMCLHELLDFLDNSPPDQNLFEVMKRIYLVAASETVSVRESVLPYQYMQICRKLSSGEVLVLMAARMAQDDKEALGSLANKNRRLQWEKVITEKSGLKHLHLVRMHERSLVEISLVLEPKYFVRQNVSVLTDLGQAICDYILQYDELKN